MALAGQVQNKMERRRHAGLRVTITSRIGIAVLVVMVVSAWITYAQSSSTLQAQSEKTAQARADVAAQQVNGLVRIVQARSLQRACNGRPRQSDRWNRDADRQQAGRAEQHARWARTLSPG